MAAKQAPATANGRSGQSVRNGRHETDNERYDRNFNELLQELRVTQTGTQIFFAFLLTIAFTRVFRDSDDFVQDVFTATLLLCAVATGLFIAPVALHRILFQHGYKKEIVQLGSRMALAGTYVLMFALAGALLLALDYTLGRTAAVATSTAVLAGFVVLWLVVPLVMRRRLAKR